MKFTDHAKEKMAEYDISEREISESLENPNNLFLDVLTGRFVAVKMQTEGKALITVFEKNDEVTVVTVFPTSKINKVVEKRVRSGRWLEL